MKHPLFILLSLLGTLCLSAQPALPQRAALSIGFLQGGGSLLGADFEFLVTDHIGLQVGGGFVGFGGALTYHIQPGIRTHHLALTYWHQGTGASFAQDALGASFIFRGKKWLTFQFGFAGTLRQGPAWPSNIEQASLMFLYSIGFYLVP